MNFKSFLLIALLLPITTFAKDEGQEIEIFPDIPTKAFKFISPISADKDSVDGAFKRLKEKAKDLKADAIMELKCEAGQKVREGWLKVKTSGTSSVCQGTAIKWAAQ